MRATALAAFLLAFTPGVAFAQDNDTSEPSPFVEYLQLEQQSIWVANPRPKPFAHDIGPDADTMPGRLLGLRERLSSDSALTATLLALELGVPVSSNPEYRPTEDVLQALRSEQPLISALIEASRQRSIPVPIDGTPGTLNRGYDDPLLRLRGLIRWSSRILLCDALRLWHEGDHDAAVERVAATFRLARVPEGLVGHTDPDEPMAALVRVAVLNNAIKVTTAMSDAGLTDAQRAALRETINGFDAEDPAGVRGPWQPHALAWARFARAGVPEGEPAPELRFALQQSVLKARAMHAIGQAFDEDANREPDGTEPVCNPATATAEQFEAAIAQTEALAEQIAERWTDTGFAVWWATIEPELAAEPTGLPFAATQWVPILQRTWADDKAWHDLRASLDE